MTGQRGYLQDCCNRYGDFKVAVAWTDNDGNPHWSKHRSVMSCWESEEGLRFLDRANNRQLFPHEIVLDLDDDFSEKKLSDTCELLQKFHLAYQAYSSGSRGYHIHILLLSGQIMEARRNFLSLDEARRYLINLCLADPAKIRSNSMIALQNAPHWKTGRVKTLLRSWP